MIQLHPEALMFKVSRQHRIGAFFRYHNYLQKVKDPIRILGLAYKIRR